MFHYGEKRCVHQNIYYGYMFTEICFVHQLVVMKQVCYTPQFSNYRSCCLTCLFYSCVGYICLCWLYMYYFRSTIRGHETRPSSFRTGAKCVQYRHKWKVICCLSRVRLLGQATRQQFLVNSLVLTLMGLHLTRKLVQTSLAIVKKKHHMSHHAMLK